MPCSDGRGDHGVKGAACRHPAWHLLDELVLHLVPVVPGTGERLLEGVGGLALVPMEVVASPTVTHLRYRISRRPSVGGRPET